MEINMKGIFSLYLLTVLYVTSTFGLICINKTDGVYETNCRAYSRCIEGVMEIITCNPGDAYNTKTQKCESKWNVPPPCGTYRDCADKDDGFYADLETHCTSFFVCSGGVFFGHTLCPPGLVYDVNQGVCDYVYSAPPPCGTNTTASAL